MRESKMNRLVYHTYRTTKDNRQKLKQKTTEQSRDREGSLMGAAGSMYMHNLLDSLIRLNNNMLKLYNCPLANVVQLN